MWNRECKKKNDFKNVQSQERERKTIKKTITVFMHKMKLTLVFLVVRPTIRQPDMFGLMLHISCNFLLLFFSSFLLVHFTYALGVHIIVTSCFYDAWHYYVQVAGNYKGGIATSHTYIHTHTNKTIPYCFNYLLFIFCFWCKRKMLKMKMTTSSPANVTRYCVLRQFNVSHNYILCLYLIPLITL